MSHNVKLSNIKFQKLDVLKMAVAELRNEGANIELIEGTGLTARQRGSVPCDVLLKVNDGKWDVGFVRENGAYVPQLESDFRNSHLSSTGQPIEGCRVDYGHVHLGQLEQRYAVIQAEINAAQAGMTTTREHDRQRQRITLTVN